ncbi:MAG: 50S ribosomal protein L6 [Gammaproteobacteria bacterium]|nr:50S ribosomal protein L6 [Gammaproteobacteria bacterium]
MSRIAKSPVNIPAGVQVVLKDSEVTVKGPKGELVFNIHHSVDVLQDGNVLKFAPKNPSSGLAIVATTRSLLNNMVVGVTSGFEKKLELVGVGYRAQSKGKQLSLSLGFSHPVEYMIPEGIVVETPSQTEILIKGSDKQKVGQVAADIRSYRPPEPYKGKGVRYSDETIVRKEAKKK